MDPQKTHTMYETNKGPWNWAIRKGQSSSNHPIFRGYVFFQGNGSRKHGPNGFLWYLWPVRPGHRRGWALENGMKGVAMWASGGSQSPELYILLDWSSRFWEYLDGALLIDVVGFQPTHGCLQDFWKQKKSKNESNTQTADIVSTINWHITWPLRWRAGISSGYGVLTSDGASRSYRHRLSQLGA